MFVVLSLDRAMPHTNHRTTQDATKRNETKRNETRKKIFAASLLSFASGDRSDCARFCAARRATAVLGRCELGSRGEPWLVVRTRLRAPILYRVGQRLWAYPCGVCLGPDNVVSCTVMSYMVISCRVTFGTKQGSEWSGAGVAWSTVLHSVQCALCGVC